MELSGRNALVVGLGKSGVAAARLLASKGARVAVTDAKPERELAAQLQGLQLDALFAGGISEQAFDDRDLVVLSPGVPRAHPHIAAALARGVELIGEVELAARFIPEPLLGITGTNGKSTTTALTGHLLQTASIDAFVGGNLGTPLSQRVLDGKPRKACVVELSSFQLESIVQLHCAAATVLNVTPDHLDRYPSLDAYAAAKERIFENQHGGDLAALNVADPRVAAMTVPAGAQRVGFDPTLADATGAERAAGLGYAVEALRTGPRTLRVGQSTFELRAKTLRGAHNAENALAALLLARHLGAGDEALQRGLDTYPGLPHRLEPVAVQGGVEWINDSKATNVDSVEKSLSAFEAGTPSVIIVMGGRGKGAPYTPLRALFQGRVKALLTIGEDAPRVAQELGDLAETHACGDLARACALARKLARSGDTVLLSPACASYDQFKSFEHRGDTFKQLVREGT